MDGLRQYIVCVTAAAIICGIAKTISDEKSVSGTVIRLITGIIMAMTVLSPIVNLELGELPALSGNIIAEAQAAAADGEEKAAQKVNAIINEQLEAYILDKAADLSVTLEIELIRPDNGSVLPEEITLYGTISPYAKTQLQQIITQDLGIAKENQRWIG